MVKESSKSMSQLIEDMLYYSKNVRDNEGRQLINIAVVDEVLKLLIPQEDVQIEKVNLNHTILFQPAFIK
jgi:hypothetical protein